MANTATWERIFLERGYNRLMVNGFCRIDADVTFVKDRWAVEEDSLPGACQLVEFVAKAYIKWCT